MRKNLWLSASTILLFFVLAIIVARAWSEKPVPVRLSQRVENPSLPSGAPDKDVFYFGFDRRLEPREDVKMYLSFLRYLERSTGYHFALHITPKNASIVEELGQGKVQFAAIGTLSYLEAHDRYGVRVLVKGLTEEKKGTYRGMIITQPNSPLRSLPDLKGKTFAFGARNSTQGHLIPRILLFEAGIRLSDLAAFEYTGSHFEAANAVISGRYDAGGIQDTLARELAKKGLVRILATSPCFPSSTISANAQVDPQVIEKVRQALLAFDPLGKDQEGLYHWEQSEMPAGFTTATDEDYAEARHWALRLGLLEPGPFSPEGKSNR
ncbi:MAG: phosphate/phosphite/phosphonate ABC transporter substrate-binding protein [Firmicutes bacterium]|nr:phosphate/phosphite/phosphonate ABC transporter substrate-binding protein [Bacillota bacterium]